MDFSLRLSFSSLFTSVIIIYVSSLPRFPRMDSAVLGNQLPNRGTGQKVINAFASKLSAKSSASMSRGRASQIQTENKNIRTMEISSHTHTGISSRMSMWCKLEAWESWIYVLPVHDIGFGQRGTVWRKVGNAGLNDALACVPPSSDLIWAPIFQNSTPSFGLIPKRYPQFPTPTQSPYHAWPQTHSSVPASAPVYGVDSRWGGSM